MRLRSRSLRQITGRRRDFHAFARRATGRVHHAHACMHAP